ncbi:amino acid racemase [Streptomyces sp. LP11]|uniref:Amino acid racemase n=1 Tax=Streptomyces pyxinicus TaxID=2970331 RepID=A0ABT2B515_9ACTN|nr:amino acid racemase [Streptomyces sp. LP11]MCS0603451.1 amino acid racemase [Streptomyces sp. LP11]
MLGVLGGMGPLATADFYRRLVERTPAEDDQAHLPVLMWADPAVPDRTAALLGHGPSPLPSLVEGARRLRRAGATCLAVPCNTAHAYLGQVSRVTGIEVLDMVDAALRAAVRAAPGVRRVGVLATRGTRRAGLYERAAARLGVEVVHVPERVQEECVDAAVRAVKGGSDRRRAEAWVGTAAEALGGLGAQVAVAACTEIPLVAGVAARVLPLVDSTDALADAAVARLWRPPAREVRPPGRERARTLVPTDGRAGPHQP